MWEFFENTFLPALAMVALSIVTVAGPPILYKGLEKLGITVEKDRQAIFQKGIDNAAEMIVARSAGGRITSELVRQGVDYVQSSVGDQVKHFQKQGLTQADIAEKVEARALARATPIPDQAVAVVQAEGSPQQLAAKAQATVDPATAVAAAITAGARRASGKAAL